MKIGIVSMQRLINYGSFLQAYGLKHLLEDLGHTVEFIDVKLSNGKFLNIPQKEKINPVKELLRPILKSKMHNLSIKRERNFKNVYFKILGLTEYPNEKLDYEATVIGSDEVFSYCQFVKWGGTELYFGEGIKSDKLISYAASFGYTTIEDLKKINMDEQITNYLKKFDAISVRDKNSREIVEKLCGATPNENLDPVLIYDFEKLVPQKVKHKNYIFVYGYDNRLVEGKYVNQIKAFAKKHKKKIVCAGVYQDWCDVMVDVNPFELLSYVKNADFVVSETFHGTVFSIKYQKDFAVIVRDSNRNKLLNLMEKFNVADRIVDKDNLEAILKRTYDKEFCVKKIEEERKKTKEYLVKSLER